MEDLSLILGLIKSHPLIAIAIAAYLLFFRGGGEKSPASGGFNFKSILAYVLKTLLSKLEPQPPTDPNAPPPAPFDFTEFLKRLFEEFLKARETGDKEHEEAVIKVLKKCEHCAE